MNNKLDKLNVKIFADGADKNKMIEMNNKKFISGLTTNPTLMRKSGINDYKEFCLDILKTITEKPISFEVFSDDFVEIEDQATEISSWGSNVYVKIPVMNTKKETCYKTIQKLSKNGVKLNVTAVMTLNQVNDIINNLDPSVNSYVSIFAGRIADTSIDPIPIMEEALKIMSQNIKSELIWASPRELLNIFQANEIGCHIITVTPSIIDKLNLIDYDLNEYSLDTVKMFFNDAKKAGYKLD